jgi:putative transposase
LDRADVFFSDKDCEIYLGLVTASAERFGTDLLGFCLMSNHVHWVVVPRQPDALARTFGEAHQNRFFSCPLDESYLWIALRYVERNPVRARMVEQASAYRWSSAAVHTGMAASPNWLQSEPWQSNFTAEQWAICLKSDSIGEAELEMRNSTYTGRPVGSPEFVQWAESNLGRTLAAKAGGRPKQAHAAVGQDAQAGLFDL